MTTAVLTCHPDDRRARAASYRAAGWRWAKESALAAALASVNMVVFALVGGWLLVLWAAAFAWATWLHARPAWRYLRDARDLERLADANSDADGPRAWWICTTVGCEHRFCLHSFGEAEAMGEPRRCCVAGCKCEEFRP